MAKVDSFKCDQCGKQKQEVNHWYALSFPGLSIALHRWEDIDPNGVNIFRHLCGQQCVIAETAAWMNEHSAQRSEPTER